MIQIQHGIGNKSLDEIAQWHWEKLNPMVSEGEFHKSALVEKFKEAIIKYQNDGKVAEAKFCSAILAKNNHLLHRLVTSQIGSFPDIISEIDLLLKSLELLPLDTSTKGQGSIGHDLLYKIMNYSGWRSDGSGVELYEQLNIEVCPYCNLGLIHKDEIREFLVAHYDHFYDKATYPYLCLSFYNLVPVCHPCNTPYKGIKPFGLDTHLHPYKDNYNQTVIFSSDYTNDSMPHAVSIAYSGEDEARARKFNDDLGISVRYNENNVKKYGRLIFILSQQYQQTQKDELCSKLNLTLPEVEKHICSISDVPYNEIEILNLQYGKLKRDLSIKNKIITTA
jgi:hypothetical protein